MKTAFQFSRQRGSALITALSILLVLTVLGVSAMSTSALQERMAGNARDAEVAFEAAEAALRAAENYLQGSYSASDFSSTGGSGGKFSMYASSAPDRWKDETNWTTSGKHAVYSSYSGNVGSNYPLFIIERVNASLDTAASESNAMEASSYSNRETEITGDIGVFQITARGYGLSANSRVMLQSYYGILNP